MVKKSKKSKSKRVTLRQKYKIIRKVKEHHKKKAKEAKKLGNRKPKVEKDPGIPNAWPFKEEELKLLEERRARVLKEIEEKKAAKKQRAKERAERRKLGLPEEDDAQLAELVRQADARASEFKTVKKKRERDTSKADGSKKAFYKELLKVIEASDVVIQVLDARDPMGTRCPEVEQLVHKSGSPKRLILVLNKIDLVPKEIAEKWLKYLREELPAVAFKCSTQKQKAKLGQKKAKKVNDILETSDCLGAETLLQLLKNYSRSEDLKRTITVGIVGVPNVGKSSLINSLKRTRAVSTGATPGLTRAMQEVHLDKHVKLLDCPGVVLPSAAGGAVDLRNCVKVEKLDDPITPVKEILRVCGHEKLMCIYKISSFSSVEEFLQLVATIRGKFKKGGVLDTETAARIVLYEWNEGKIPHYTVPPVRESSDPSESAIVASLGKEFNVDEVFKAEQSTVIAGLSSLMDLDYAELPASAPRSLDTGMLEESENEESEEEEEIEREEEVKRPEEMMDTSEAAAPVPEKETSGAGAQTLKLYDAEGIFNPRLARAERKRRKKSSKLDENGAEDMQGTYDFEVDYQANNEAPLQTDEKQKKSKKKTNKRKTPADAEAMEM